MRLIAVNALLLITAVVLYTYREEGCVPAYCLRHGRGMSGLPQTGLPGDLMTVKFDPMQPSRPCSPARKHLRMMTLMRCHYYF